LEKHIRNVLIQKGITRVKFRPEGFWNKYGGLTADIAITTSAIALGEIADLAGDVDGSNQASKIAFQSDFHNLHKEQEEKASS